MVGFLLSEYLSHPTPTFEWEWGGKRGKGWRWEEGEWGGKRGSGVGRGGGVGGGD